jgi:Domain of unknown function (DUF5666)
MHAAMKALTLLCAAAIAAGGCSQRDVTLRGSLGEGWRDERLFVSVDGMPERVEIQGDTFALSGISAGRVTLRIGSEDAEIARIDIRELAAGASLSLERLRRDRARHLAFPSAIRIEGGGPVTINGIRMADPGSLPPRLEAEGVVLALSDGRRRLLVRPGSGNLPDLPVVATDSTRVLDAAGEDASLRRLSPGDSVQVAGRTEAGYLYAERITMAGARESSGTPAEPARSTGRARDDEEARDEAEPRESRGRGREDRQVPAGHRPPPGECRDWNPNLPPGQQPPPRKC